MAISQVITTLPPAPQRTDAPADFSAKADARIASETGFVTELNVFGSELNTTQTEINTSETNASTSQAAAALSATESESSNVTSQSNANFLGRWSDATGAATVPSAYSNNGATWQLLQNIADITLDEPIGGAANWQLISDVNMTNVSLTDINTPLSQFFSGNRKSVTSAPNNTEADVTVARAGVATIFNRYGKLVSILSNILRKNDTGFYFEGADTNLILYPEDATNAYWNSNVAITPTVTTAAWYSGGNVSRLTEDGTLNQRRLRRTVTAVTSGGVKTCSFIVEPDSNRMGVTAFFQGFGATVAWDLNLSTKTSSVSGSGFINDNAVIEEISSGVFYVEVSAEASTPLTNLDLTIYFSDDPADGNATYTGDGTSGIVISAIQLSETVPFGTSYIKNTGTATTRLADTVDTDTLENLPNLASPWSFITKVQMDGFTSTDSTLWGLDTAEGEKLSVKASGGVSMLDSASVTHNITTALTPRTQHTLVVTYDGGSITAYLDGVAQTPVVATFNNVDSGSILWGKSSTGNRMYGYLKAPRFIPRALTSDEVKIQ